MCISAATITHTTPSESCHWLHCTICWMVDLILLGGFNSVYDGQPFHIQEQDHS